MRSMLVIGQIQRRVSIPSKISGSTPRSDERVETLDHSTLTAIPAAFRYFPMCKLRDVIRICGHQHMQVFRMLFVCALISWSSPWRSTEISQNAHFTLPRTAEKLAERSPVDLPTWHPHVRSRVWTDA